jgi:DNA-directed RNA polymerase specialized sigma24 family protein
MQTTLSVLEPPLIQNVGQIADDFDIFDEISRVELYEAIDGLPKPRERFALLGVLAGKKTETIAEELGVTVTAVYNLTKKAKMALKERMKGRTK